MGLEERFNKEFRNEGFIPESRLKHILFIEKEVKRALEACVVEEKVLLIDLKVGTWKTVCVACNRRVRKCQCDGWNEAVQAQKEKIEDYLSKL